MSFCMYNHVEEIERIFGFQNLLEERIREMETQFMTDVRQLLMYRRVSSESAYAAAAHEAYMNMNPEMTEYLRMYDIDTFSKFLIYVEGIAKGMEISRGKKR